MGQKINPIGLRIGINCEWVSQWVANKKTTIKWLQEDYLIRKMFEERFPNVCISKIIIQRQDNLVKIFVHTSQVGILLGQKGSNIMKITKWIKILLVDRTYVVKVQLVEEKNPGFNAQILSNEIAHKIGNRENYKKIQYSVIKNAQKLGVLGIKITIGGRLNGANIARKSTQSFGKLPLSTLRIPLDYGYSTARTGYGAIGVKVWIYKKEKTY